MRKTSANTMFDSKQCRKNICIMYKILWHNDTYNVTKKYVVKRRYILQRVKNIPACQFDLTVGLYYILWFLENDNFRWFNFWTNTRAQFCGVEEDSEEKTLAAGVVKHFAQNFYLVTTEIILHFYKSLIFLESKW